MKTAGIIGGIAPESTIQYYRKAVADFAAMASNTPHVVFNELQRQSPIPLISIVEVACDAAKNSNLKKVGVLGTRFTMQGTAYPNSFSQAKIDVVAPNPIEQDFIHNIYMNELVRGILLPDTKLKLREIIEAMLLRDNIDGVILAGTELPLMLTESSHKGIPLLDTTRLHVQRIVETILA